MSKTIFDKIWDRHLISDLGGGSGLVLIDRILLHERTGGVALKSLAESGRTVASPQHVFATMDHIVDTLPGRTDRTLMPTGTAFIQETRAAAKAAGITLFDLGDPRQGIVHVISPEQGIVLPGLTLVCPDSHTCTQGAFGALAWGIGSSEGEHALATTTLRVKKPRRMRIWVDGLLPERVSAKDLALYLIAELGSAGADGCIVEFAGPAITALDLEGRLTLCNLATEMAAFSAIVAPDDKVFDYLQGRPFAPKGDVWNQAVADWRTLASDEGASFDIDHHFDAGLVRPMVTWGTSPEQAMAIGRGPAHRDGVAPARERALTYMGLPTVESLTEQRIDAAFIGSCTNSRIADLRRAAALLKGRHVAAHVRAICVPGSGAVKAEAEAEGLDVIFREAGFEWREPGCSMCFFAGGEGFKAGERVITSTNRNFEGRQGPGARSHLASPETVAASAIAGRIVSAQELEDAT